MHCHANLTRTPQHSPNHNQRPMDSMLNALSMECQPVLVASTCIFGTSFQVLQVCKSSSGQAEHHSACSKLPGRASWRPQTRLMLYILDAYALNALLNQSSFVLTHFAAMLHPQQLFHKHEPWPAEQPDLLRKLFHCYHSAWLRDPNWS